MGAKTKVKEAAKKAIGDGVNSVIECVDVDGIVRRVEINALMERIDWNAVLDSIDIDRQLDRVNVNRLLGRVDFNAIVERVDMQAIVVKSDVGSIMVQSTTGIFTHFLDAIRTQVVVIDLLLLRVSHFRKWSDTKGALPLAPGDSEELEYDECPSSKAEKAVAVQGRYSGFFSKAIAIFIDCACLTASFAAIVLVVRIYSVLFVGEIRGDVREKVNKEEIWKIVGREHFGAFVMYCIYWFLYFFLGIILTGKTLGMGLAGIKVVDCTTGLKISASQAFVRTIILPFTVTLMPFLNIIGFLRRDGRMLHDIVADCGTVYRWDARLAGLREKAEQAEEEAELHRRQLERAHRISVRSSLGTSTTPSIEARLSEDSPNKSRKSKLMSKLKSK